MAEQIIDGKGSGKRAKVNSYNQLVVRAISGSVEHWSNHDQEKAYHVLFDQTPTAAGDCFFYLKNTSDMDIIIEGFTCSVASAEQIEVYLGDTGTPVGGTTLTPVNANTNAGGVATGTFQAGNDITGLTQGSKLDKVWFTSAASTAYNFEVDVVVGTNGVFTMCATAGAKNVRGTIYFYYEDVGA